MQRALKRAIKLGKTHFKLLLVGVFLLILLFFGFSKVFAYEPDLPAEMILFENFDNWEGPACNNGLPLWEQSCGTYNAVATSTRGFYSSPHALGAEFLTGNEYWAWTEPVFGLKQAGTIDKVFWRYKHGRRQSSLQGSSFSQYIRGRYYVGDNPLYNYIFWFAYAIGPERMYIRTGQGDFTLYNITNQNWRSILFELDFDTEKGRWSLDEGATFSNWYDFQNKGTNWTGEYGLGWGIEGAGYNGTYNALDEIYSLKKLDWPYWFWFYDIGVEITYPEVGSTTELPAGNATTTGNWAVASGSNMYWDKMYAVVKNLATGVSKVFSTAIDGYAGNSGNFSIDIYGLDDGNYSLCWASTGTDTWWTRWAYFYCEEENRTLLRVGDYPELPRYILLESFEECDYEDCSELGTLERLVCGIKNFIVSLSCPEPEKLLDLQISVNEMKNRFPASYLRLARQEYNFLREEIGEKESFTMSILGNEGEVNVNFFDNIGDGKGNSLMDYFRWFFGGLLALAFILYGLYFIKRIF